MKYRYTLLLLLGMPFLQAMGTEGLRRRGQLQVASARGFGRHLCDEDAHKEQIEGKRNQIRAVQKDNRRLEQKYKPDSSGCLGSLLGLVMGMILKSYIDNPYKEVFKDE